MVDLNKKIIIFLLVLILFFGGFQFAQGVTKGIGETATITITCSDPDGNLLACYIISPCNEYCYSSFCSCTFTCTSPGTYSVLGMAEDTWGETDSKYADDPIICIEEDTTSPAVSINSPAAGSWQTGNFSLGYSITDDTEIAYCHLYTQSSSETGLTYQGEISCGANRNTTIYVGSTNWCFDQGPNACRVDIRGVDAAGNTADDTRYFSIDYTAPYTPSIDFPPADSIQNSDFSVSVSGDGDVGDSGLTCYYHVYDSGVGWTKTWVTRTCNSSFTVTVGADKDCQTDGGTCTVYASAQDGVGNTGSSNTRTFNINLTVCSPLNYPTTEWQRVWYDLDWNCLGDGPNETAEEFDNNWGWGVVAYGRSDDIIFSSSRKIYISETGIYRFVLGSDDGSRLYIGGTLYIDAWSDHPYQEKFIDVNLTGGNYYNLQIDYYERGNDARVSFSYISVPPPSEYSCSIYSGFGSTNETDCLAGCSSTYWYSYCHYAGLESWYCMSGLKPTQDCSTETIGPCNITICQKGWDDSDNDCCQYGKLAETPTSQEFIFDDNSSGSDCDNDLRVKSSWSKSGDQITVKTDILEKNAAHDLGAGFIFDSGGCPFSASLVGIADNGNMNVIGEGYYPASVATLGTTKGAEPGEYLTWYIDLASDTTPPTTNIKFKRSYTDEDLTDKWAKPGDYEIVFEDNDNLGVSNLKKCEYFILSCDANGENCNTTIVPQQSRDCNGPILITAGKDAPMYNKEGYSYLIYSLVQDMANNYSEWDYQYLWFDFTEPATEIR